MFREWQRGKEAGLSTELLLALCRAFQCHDLMSPTDLLWFIRSYILETKRKPYYAVKALDRSWHWHGTMSSTLKWSTR